MIHATERTAPVIERASRRLLEGGLVAFPTETVYGLGADAENIAAVDRIYAAKGRPSNHPVIVHVAPGADLSYWVSSVPQEAQALIDAFWPGPLTLILPRASNISSRVSGGQASIGIRCPSHPVAQALLARFAELKGGHGGVAAPSANKFGQVSPTRAEHVRAEFAELDDDALLVLEGGASEVGIESTIVDVSRLDEGTGPVLLRPGHITAEDLARVLRAPVRTPDAAAPRVSGSLKAHYAPHTPLLLARRTDFARILADAKARGERVALAGFEPMPASPEQLAPALWHSCDPDSHAYAQKLYAMLRELDEGGFDRIVIEEPPKTPAWQAVNDRLGRAAAAFSS